MKLKNPLSIPAYMTRGFRSPVRPSPGRPLTARERLAAARLVPNNPFAGGLPLRAAAGLPKKPKPSVKESVETQRFLRSRGYDIDTDGEWGPESKAALADWHKGVGRRNPAAWNISRRRATAVGINRNRMRNNTGAGPGGNEAPPRGTSPTNQNVPSRTAQATSGLAGLGAGLGRDIGYLQQLAAAGYGDMPDLPDDRMDPGSYAKAQADMRYGAQESLMKYLMEKQTAQGRQNTADISNWYGQVKGQLEAAIPANRAAEAAALAEQDSSTAAITASIGGAASEAAGAVAQTGEQNEGLLRALGLSQSNYDQGALGQVSLETAGQLLRQKRLDASKLADMAQELRSLGSERGAFESETRMGAEDENYQKEMERFSLMQELNQQRFSNLAAIPAMKISAAMAGPELTKAWREATAPDDTTGGLTASQILTQQRWEAEQDKKDAEAARKRSRGVYGQLTPQQRSKMVGDGVTLIRAPNGAFRLGNAGTVRRVNSYISSFGIKVNSPAGKQVRAQILRAAGFVVGPKGNIGRTPARRRRQKPK